MHCTLLKAKLHRACVTHAELDYEGSCAIDGQLLDIAGIYEYEQIQIYNLNNGERLITYAIRAEEHSRIISINGAAAHKAQPQDRIIICAYVNLTPQEIALHKPILVYLDATNTITHTRHTIPVQTAAHF
ncbi:MAG: aspartate 1-decarboxylase [Pseudomonadota bacterium]|nr:aspartate 1-decarboxylase [Pseudomonadota bacterium]